MCDNNEVKISRYDKIKVLNLFVNISLKGCKSQDLIFTKVSAYELGMYSASSMADNRNSWIKAESV